jgi:hypothetical protein
VYGSLGVICIYDYADTSAVKRDFSPFSPYSYIYPVSERDNNLEKNILLLFLQTPAETHISNFGLITILLPEPLINSPWSLSELASTFTRLSLTHHHKHPGSTPVFPRDAKESLWWVPGTDGTVTALPTLTLAPASRGKSHTLPPAGIEHTDSPHTPHSFPCCTRQPGQAPQAPSGNGLVLTESYYLTETGPNGYSTENLPDISQANTSEKGGVSFQ